MFLRIAAIASAVLLLTAKCQSTFSPARPPSIPLAVKSPYMNTWQDAGSDGGNGGYLAGQWPQFWANQVTGWAGLIRVDSNVYTWLGAPEVGTTFPPSVNQISFEYTSQRSSFILDVEGKVSLNVTFLSPITPDDLKRQSIIGSYLDVSVVSVDGASHSVQLYSDISAEWVAGDHSQSATWSYASENGIASHRVWRTTQNVFSETNNQADWGYWYWSTDNVTGLTYQSGTDIVVREAFASSGVLADTQDSNYRAIDEDYPVFGFANDLGTVGTTPVSTLFTLILAQEDAIYFNGASGNVSVPSLWTSYFSTEAALVEFFHTDYSTQTGVFDQQIATDSLDAAGQDYLTITSLSARQAFAGVQLTGTPNKTYVFLKEISSDGDIQTVDVIFPAHPIFLYLNPSLLKYQLDPLFEYQETGQWPEQFSIHDLGYYPNAIGHNDGNDELQPLEECGNMLIMTLAYAQRADDTDYLSEHYTLLKQWTSFLVQESLIPANQISTDDFAGSLANQTNLALKGIIGIQAFAVIANLTGNTADGINYTSIAQNYITQWQGYGINTAATPPHSELAYNDASSWGLLYNLYADKELGTNLVPSSIYDIQSNFYPTVALEYGVPLDTRHNYTKSDWSMFCAAIASNTTKAMFISKLAAFINDTPTNVPFTDLYDANTSDFPSGYGFAARPVVGGHFALLALNDAPTDARSLKASGGKKKEKETRRLVGTRFRA